MHEQPSHGKIDDRWFGVAFYVRSAAVENRTVVVAATPLRQSIEDRGGGMEAPYWYGIGKRVRPVEIVFFPGPATSGGPGEDV